MNPPPPPRCCRRNPEARPYPSPGSSSLRFLCLVLLPLLLASPVIPAADSPLSRPANAADSLDEVFKRALFAEEGRRDFDSAIRDYQQVVRAMDDQRRLAASALFRLGEVFRKQRKTNDAVIQFQRVLKEFPGEDTLVQISRQNLAALGVEPANSQKSLPVAAEGQSGPTSAPGFLASPSTADLSQAGPLTAQLTALRRLRSEPMRQAQAVQALFPDTRLDQLLTRLPEMQRATERLRQHPGFTGRSEGSTNPVVIIQGGPSPAGISMVFREDNPTGTPAELQAAELRRHTESIQERVDHILSLQEARLGVLQAMDPAASTTAASAGLTSAGRLVQELALLEAQLESVKKMDPTAARRALRTFFPADTKGIELLGQQLADAELREARLSESFAAAHPDRQAVHRELELLSKKLTQEASDVLASQEARLEALRRTLTTLRAEGTPTAKEAEVTSGTSAKAATQEEEQEIRRIQSLVANSPDLINNNNGKSWPLVLAAQKGQLTVAKYLLDHGAKPNLGERQSTPLHAAAQAGHKALVELLLERGAAPNAIDDFGRTPLHIATQAGFLAISEVLLAKGANPNAVLVRHAERTDDTPQFGGPLNAALDRSRLDVVRLLLDKGADPNLRDEGRPWPRDSGNPPLLFAQSKEAVQLLLSKGADPNLPGRQGTTLLHKAAQGGSLPILQALLDGGAHPDGPTHASTSVMTPLAIAVEAGQRETADALLKAGAQINRMGAGVAAIHLALRRTDFDLTKWALDNGADPNLRNEIGETPLEWAWQCDETTRDARTTAGGSASAATGQVLPPRAMAPQRVPRSPSVGVPVPGIPTPLGPGAPSAAGMPPVIGSARSEPQEELGPFVLLLLDRGADVNQPISDGSRFVHYLARRRFSGEVWKELLKKKIDVNPRAERDVTPLMIAVGQGHPPTVKILLQAGADVLAQDALGNSALHYAVLEQTGFIRDLIDAKASPTQTNAAGITPIQLVKDPPSSFNRDRFGILVPLSYSSRQTALRLPGSSDGEAQRRQELLSIMGVSTNAAPGKPTTSTGPAEPTLKNR